MIVQDRVVQVVEFHGKRSKSRKIRIAIIPKISKRKKFAKKISKIFDQSEGWTQWPWIVKMTPKMSSLGLFTPMENINWY